MYYFLTNFIRFSRLHTIIGTSLSVICLYAIAYQLSDITEHHWQLLVLVLISCLGANVYIVGLNQITDIEIDKINKPYLPLASGAFTLQTGYWIIGISILVSLAIAFTLNPYLIATVLLSLFLGTIYSLPPFRLKRFPFWAAFCIIAVRGLIINVLLFLTFYYDFTGKNNIPLLIWILTFTFFIFGTIIAWFKDLPDVEGDAAFSITTFSISWGKEKVFLVGKIVLGSLFFGLCLLPYVIDLPIHRYYFSGSQLILLGLFLYFSARLDLEDIPAIKRYYQFVWILFFLEYLIFAGTTI